MEECLPLTEDHVSTSVLFSEHVITLIILILWIRTTHKTVEVSHPMYALLYQEIIVLALFASLNIIVLLVITSGEGTNMTMISGIYVFVYVAALQFHQVTCLSAACLRCHLNGKKPSFICCIVACSLF